MSETLSLNFTESGDQHDTSVFILHGLFGSLSNWRSIARSLSKQYHVVTSDARNHGDSPWNAQMDYHVMADDLARLIERNAHDRIIVMGHSMGGKTTMQLALRNSLNIEKFIIVDIAPVSYLSLQQDDQPNSHTSSSAQPRGAGEDHAQLIDSMQSLDMSSIENRTSADEALSVSVKNIAVRQFLLQNLIKRQADATYEWRLNLDAIRNNLSRLMDWIAAPQSGNAPTCPAPTLFIRGENSPYLAQPHQLAIAAPFPNHQISRINNAGHWPHAERPDEFLKTVTTFLSL